MKNQLKSLSPLRKIIRNWMAMLITVLLTFPAIAQVSFKEYRENVHQLLKEDRIDEIKVEYYSNRQLPYFNIWETLYFHLKKKEFDNFFLRITEYTRYLYHFNGNLTDEMHPHRVQENKYLFESHTDDDLWKEVKTRISIHPTEILYTLDLSGLDGEQSKFIELFVHYMVWYFYKIEDEIDQEIDRLSSSFIMSYPSSDRVDFIDKFISNRVMKSRVKWMVHLGTDYTTLGGRLGSNIAPTPNFSFNSGMQFNFKNFLFGWNMSVLDCRVNEQFDYQVPWVPDSNVLILNFDFLFGYSHRLHRNLSVHPFLAYRLSNLSYSHKDAFDEDLNQFIRLTSHSPMIGCYFDIEFLHNYWEGLSERSLQDSYSQKHFGLRIGLSYAFNNFQRYTPELNGNSLMISAKLMMGSMWPRDRRRMQRY
jgi:hypothetical protein